MSKQQRLVFIATGYSEGILFSQEDSILAYKLLTRATMVRKAGSTLFPDDMKDVEIILTSPKNVAPAEPEAPPVKPFPTVEDLTSIPGPSDFLEPEQDPKGEPLF